MAGIIVGAGAVRQKVGSHELVQFLLLLGGQEIEENLTGLIDNLKRKLRDYWRLEVMSMSGVDPVQALASIGRELEPALAGALPLALRECRRLIEADDDVRFLSDYLPNLVSEIEDFEYLATNALRLSRTLRVEVDLTP